MVKFLLLALATAGSMANARPNTYSMTCSAAQDLVQSSGAIVMNYGYSSKAGYLYERYVSNQQYCALNERATIAYAPTTDDASCVVGYTCEERSSH